MAGTFQNLSEGRLLLNVVTGGEEHEQLMYGDDLDKAARYERAGEFLHVVRSLWSGETVDFEGKHLFVRDARLEQIPSPIPSSTSGAPRPSARSGGPACRRLPHVG